MRIRTERVKRKVSIKDNEVTVDLDARDIMTKEDFINIYENRVQEKSKLEDNIANYKQHLEKVKSYEDEEGIKELAIKIKKDTEFAQKIYAILQKRLIVEQLQSWEKALEGMNKELEDLSPMYKKLKKDKEGNEKK